ncbi:hypothetical protein IF1G_06182 [Cordyceps javanica]|uniref:Uncharacterized protein n=1 Tax=Cordyceps javanica TaxID=43265 RepID=A0A545V0F0_9HYPO|nr:hypothetical protein IF1G_06182 [Cordyceps javanica]
MYVAYSIYDLRHIDGMFLGTFHAGNGIHAASKLKNPATSKLSRAVNPHGHHLDDGFSRPAVVAGRFSKDRGKTMSLLRNYSGSIHQFASVNNSTTNLPLLQSSKWSASRLV